MKTSLHHWHTRISILKGSVDRRSLIICTGEVGNIDFSALIEDRPVVLETQDLSTDPHTSSFQGEWIIEAPYSKATMEGYVSIIPLDEKLHKNLYEPIALEVSKANS